MCFEVFAQIGDVKRIDDMFTFPTKYALLKALSNFLVSLKRRNKSWAKEILHLNDTPNCIFPFFKYILIFIIFQEKIYNIDLLGMNRVINIIIINCTLEREFSTTN
jgi:hypothetical protein